VRDDVINRLGLRTIRTHGDERTIRFHGDERTPSVLTNPIRSHGDAECQSHQFGHEAFAEVSLRLHSVIAGRPSTGPTAKPQHNSSVLIGHCGATHGDARRRERNKPRAEEIHVMCGNTCG
jgi:hypothetical protein